MASTNKTTHYNLSQFLGTDKPAWLGDYNSDMNKIDNGINTAQTTATGADGKADANATSIGTLSNLTTDEKTSLVAAINEVDSHADTAQGTANSASNTANGAVSSLQNLENYLKLNSITNFDENNMIPTVGTMDSSSLTVATDSTGKLGKIYGYFRHKPTSTGWQTIYVTTDTGLRPATNTTIYPIGIIQGVNNSFNANNAIEGISVDVKTDGTLEIHYQANIVPSSFFLGYMFPCVYFIEDWGDAPE